MLDALLRHGLRVGTSPSRLETNNNISRDQRCEFRIATRNQTTAARAATTVASHVATRNWTRTSRNHSCDSKSPVATRDQLCTYTVLGLHCHGPNLLGRIIGLMTVMFLDCLSVWAGLQWIAQYVGLVVIRTLLTVMCLP